MKLPCPHCGKMIDTVAAKNAPLQALNALYGRFNFAEKLVREYIKLFVPASGIMTLARETRLVLDLLEVWDHESFRRDGRDWSISRDAVAEAIEGICNRGISLKGGHGYLLTVLKARSVQISAREEREREDKRRSGMREKSPSRPPLTKGEAEGRGISKLPEITDEERAAMKERIRKDKEKLFGKGGSR